MVANVYRGTSSFEAGFVVDDEIVAVGDFRVRADQWEARAETFRVGDTVSVLVSRRDELKRIRDDDRERANGRVAVNGGVGRDRGSTRESAKLARPRTLNVLSTLCAVCRTRRLQRIVPPHLESPSGW